MKKYEELYEDIGVEHNFSDAVTLLLDLPDHITPDKNKEQYLFVDSTNKLTGEVELIRVIV